MFFFISFEEGRRPGIGSLVKEHKELSIIKKKKKLFVQNIGTKTLSEFIEDRTVRKAEQEEIFTRIVVFIFF